MNSLNRRNFLTTAAALGTFTLFGTAPIAHAAAAPKTARSIGDVLSMSPIEVAQESDVVQTAWKMILESAKKLRNAQTRDAVLKILENPAPTILEGDETTIRAVLIEKGLLDAKRKKVFPENGSASASPQPFWSAPGSGFASHHAYPGGLVTHTALNVLSAENLYRSYVDVNGLELSYDDAVGGEILHDLHKPWVFQWLESGECRKEETLAATGEHHVLSIAESMKRNLPATLVVAQACAHEHPASKEGEKLVVGWIEAAAVIAGRDPVASGYLAPARKTIPLPRRMEGWVVHLADHDWVISSSACKWSVEALKTLASEVYGVKDDKTFNAVRNYVLANLTAMRLYGILSSRGRKAFADEVARVLKA